MTTDKRSEKELLEELERLRLRLEEAEETLHAIGSGAVDAFVVSGPEGERVFTLTGAEQPYRLLVETMNEGAATLAEDGTITYANRRLAALLQTPLEQLVGTQFGSYVSPADRSLVGGLLQASDSGGMTAEIILIARSGNPVPVQISGSRQELFGDRSFIVVISDLTGRKQNEEMKTAENLSRAILVQAGEAIVVCDELGRIIRTSLRADQLCAESLLLRPFDQFFRLQLTESGTLFSVLTPLQGVDVTNEEVTFTGSGGQTVNLLLNATPLKNDQNRISGCIVTLTDITRLRQTESALLVSEIRYRNLFANMMNGFAYCRMLFDEQQLPVDFVYLEVNAAFCRLTGLDNVVGRKFTEVLPGVAQTNPELLEIYGRVAATGRLESFETSISQLGLVLAIAVYRPEPGCFAVTFESVAERKQSEKQLRKSLKRYSLLAETMLQGVVHQDADGTIIEMNPAAGRILGRTREDFLGSSSVHEEHHTIRENGEPFPGMDHPSMVALRTGLPVRDVVMGVFNPELGVYRWININAVPLFYNGEPAPSEVYTVFEDITERRQVEARIRQNEERLKLALDAAHLATWDWDITTDQVVWNSEHYRLLGYEPDSFAPTYRDWAVRVHSDDLSSTEARIRRAMECGDDYRAEFRVVLPDGTVRTLEALGRFERDVSGRAVRCYGAMSDVTGRNLMVEELRRANETLEQRVAERTAELLTLSAYNRSLIEASLDPLVTIDLDGKISDVNSATEQVTGCPRQDLIGTDFTDYFSEPQKAREGYLLVYREGQVRDYPLEIRHKDGRLTPVLYNATVYRDASGDIGGLFAAARDITRLKQAEAERELFYKFFLTSSDLMVIADPNGAFLKTNPACTDLLGYSEAELASKPFIDFVHPDDRESTLAEMASQQNIGYSMSFENRYLCKDGSCRVLSWRAVYSKDEDRTYATARDITQNKKQEEALQTSEREFRLLAEAMPQIVWITRADGWNIYFNRQWMDYTGLTLEESLGHGWNKPFHPDDQQGAWDAWQNATKYLVTYSLECRLRRADGVYKWWLIRGVPVFDDQGAVLKWFGTCTDIDEFKKAEEEKLSLEKQLLHAQKLESLGILAGGIAHDFNNILMAIIGNVELARMKSAPESPMVSNLQQIEQAAMRAADLARQMLAYSGKGKFLIAPLDLNRLVGEMLSMLEVSISRKSVLKLNLAPGLPIVEADVSQIQQVIMNLVINASEAIGDQGGFITMTTGTMECTASYLTQLALYKNMAEGLYVYLEVADSGCGMDKETLDRIFDPFFTTKFTGRGLGMAAVQGIVRGHRGGISVYSEPGRGTTFTVLLPAADKPVEVVVPEPAREGWQGSGTVLLVDDEETVRTVVVAMLQELGFTVITAGDGLEALAAFTSRGDISLVILDLTMPKLDGEQCFRELRKLDRQVRVVISSGYSEEDVAGRFQGEDVFGFIQKPYSYLLLKEMMRKICAADAVA